MHPSLSTQKQSTGSIFHLPNNVPMHSLSMYDEESYYHPTNDINNINSHSANINTPSFPMNDNHLPFNNINMSQNDYSLTDSPMQNVYSPLLGYDKLSPIICYNQSPQLLSLNNPLNSPQFNINHIPNHINNIEPKPFSLTPIPQESNTNCNFNTSFNNINDFQLQSNDNINQLERSLSNCSQSATTISYNNNNNSNNSINNSLNHYSLSPQSPTLSSCNNNNNITEKLYPNLIINNNNGNNLVPQIPINIPINNILDNILMTPKRNKNNNIRPLETPPNIDICNTSHISPPLIPSIPLIPKLPSIQQILEESNNNINISNDITNSINPINNNAVLLPFNTNVLPPNINNNHTDYTVLSVLNTSDGKMKQSENDITNSPNNNTINSFPISNFQPIKPEFDYLNGNNINITPIPLPIVTQTPTKPLKNKIKKTKTITKKEKLKTEKQITKINIKTPNSKCIEKPKKLKQTKTKIIQKKQTKTNQVKLYESCQLLNEHLTPTTKQKSEDIRRIKNPKTRRKHTAIACVKCWKAKTRCSIKRPCDRCVRIGCQDQCVDRPPSSRKRQNVTKLHAKNNVKRKTNLKKNCSDYNHTHFKCPPLPPMPPPPPTTVPIPTASTPAAKVNSENPFSVSSTSLSAIMSSFKKTTGNNKSVPMCSLFSTQILESDPLCKYLPVLTSYQILEKSYCKKCYGLLETFGSDCIDTHLQTPHNYKCPNKNCEREFVLQKHLGIHLKICKESQKLKLNVKKVTQNEFKKYINYKIKSPIDNYYTNVNDYDINPTNQWIQQQLKCKQQKMTTKQRRKNNNSKQKRGASGNMYTPPIKKRKIYQFK